MRPVLSFIASLVVCVLVWIGLNILLQEKGGHGPGDAQNHLSKMHDWVNSAVEIGFPLPDPKEYNKHIAEAWKLALEGKGYGYIFESGTSDSYGALMFIAHHPGKFYWDNPPVYVVDPSLPDGFGFYLEGEDGVSASRGEDPDDVNSWDNRSHVFYYKRRWWREQMTRLMFGLMAGSIVFGLTGLPRTRRQQDG